MAEFFFFAFILQFCCLVYNLLRYFKHHDHSDLNILGIIWNFVFSAYQLVMFLRNVHLGK